MQYDEDEDYFAGYGEDSGSQGIYSEDVLEDLEENDEISPDEEAFMEGYREAGVPKEKKDKKEKEVAAEKEEMPAVNRKRKKSSKKTVKKRKAIKRKTKNLKKREPSRKKRK